MTEPYYSDGAVTIYHGDCRDVLAGFSPGGFAALVTDPPYGMAYASNWEGVLPRSVGGDADTTLRDWILDWWGDGPALVFGTWKVKRPTGTRAVLIYDKGGATGMGDLSIPWKPSHEEVYVIGGPFAGRRDSGSVIQGRVQASAYRGRLHPCQKDHTALQALIRKCPDGTILDPFMGVGTTLRAAKNLGRPAIGIEREESYCEVATRLLGQEVMDLGAAA
jgi:DNA modification methylase